MHAAIVRLLLYEDYVWVSLGNAMKAKQSKAKQSSVWVLLGNAMSKAEQSMQGHCQCLH
jgi:hypothetical protein